MAYPVLHSEPRVANLNTLGLLHRSGTCFLGDNGGQIYLLDACQETIPLPVSERWTCHDLWAFPHPSPVDPTFRRIPGDPLKVSLAFNRGFFAPADAQTVGAIAGEVKRTLVGDLHLGDLVARRTGLASPALVSHLTTKPTGAVVPLLPQLPLGRCFGYLAGVLVGNGCPIRQDGRLYGVQLTDNCLEVRSKADLAKESLYPAESVSPRMHTREAVGEYGPTIHAVWYSTALGALLALQIGERSQCKHLPPSFSRAPREFLLALLAGLMDTDGSVNAHSRSNALQLAYYTTSYRLAREVLLLCSLLGIRANISANDHRRAPKPHYRTYGVVIDPHTFLAAGVHYEMVKPHKVDRLMKGLLTARSYDPIPIPSPVLEEVTHLLKAHGFSRKAPATLAKAANRGAMNREKALEWLEYLRRQGTTISDSIRRWETIVADNSVAWERVIRDKVVDAPLWWPTAEQGRLNSTAHGYMFGGI